MLYVVHCVDTEGPLWEPLEATFARLKSIYGIECEPTAANLERVQRGEFLFGADETRKSAAFTFSKDQLSYLTDWAALEAMLDRIDNPVLRNAVVDSEGNGWKLNWHCLAHFGFDPQRNPRRRDLGVHNVFDRYMSRYKDSTSDSIHWHYHPVPFERQANYCATNYFARPEIFEIISRRILERMWFPCVNRPGFHTERPDSHWFLEQWLPFDVANLSTSIDTGQPDICDGRFGDWRRAPDDWSVYHPSYRDYQVPGQCRRSIARCLMLEGRIAPLTPDEIEKAFRRARTQPTYLAFANHDYRDMEAGIRFVQNELSAASHRYPDVRWCFSDAAVAMRACLGLEEMRHPRFQAAMQIQPNGSHRLLVTLDQEPFGPQPWFCFSTKAGDVYFDNLDFGTDGRTWHYTFDEQTFPVDAIADIGLATNNLYGRTSVLRIDTRTGREDVAFLN